MHVYVQIQTVNSTKMEIVYVKKEPMKMKKQTINVPHVNHSVQSEKEIINVKDVRKTKVLN